jgi:aspartokinase
MQKLQLGIRTLQGLRRNNEKRNLLPKECKRNLENIYLELKVIGEKMKTMHEMMAKFLCILSQYNVALQAIAVGDTIEPEQEN